MIESSWRLTTFCFASFALKERSKGTSHPALYVTLGKPKAVAFQKR